MCSSYLSCILSKFPIVYCHPFGISPPRRTWSHLQTWKVHAFLLPGKKKRMLRKMGPSTFLSEGREPLLSLKNPCYLCPLLPVSSRSKITLQLSLQTRFLAKPLRISVASIPTQNRPVFRVSSGSEERFLLENSWAFL